MATNWVDLSLGVSSDSNNNDDDVEYDTVHQLLRMWIPMPPCAKPSVSYGPGRGGPKGFFRCFIHTDVKKKMKQFGSIVAAEAKRTGYRTIQRHKPVVLKVWCLLRRPETDFVGRRREANNLRLDRLEQSLVTVKPDTDNLAKFVLDAVTAVLFADDAQIVDLHMFKLRDNEGLCEGRVAIQARQATPQHQLEMMPDF
jgi:Holliday junction resolvase RusA-like endonuclease